MRSGNEHRGRTGPKRFDVRVKTGMDSRAAERPLHDRSICKQHDEAPRIRPAKGKNTDCAVFRKDEVSRRHHEQRVVFYRHSANACPTNPVITELRRQRLLVA